MITQTKKIYIFLLLSLFLLILAGCGFTPMYSQKNMQKQMNIYISQIELSGDRIINRTIKNNLAYLTKKANKDESKIISLTITNKLERKINTKDATGKASIYSLKLISVAEILENGVVVSTRAFEKEFIYDNNENTFELTQYEKIVKVNLGTQNSNEIIRYLINHKGS